MHGAPGSLVGRPRCFLCSCRAECSSTREMPGSIERGKDGSAYVSYYIAALWLASGHSRPGHPGDPVARLLCYPACPWWPASWLCAGTSQYYVVAHTMAGLSWPVAFVLGAVVSPTDAVAASATAKQLGLPRRIVTVIEGESMVNDATGLVIYRFAVAAVVTGSFSLSQAGLQFVVVSLGGLVIGLAIAWPVAWLHRHLDDAPIEITITLLTPYAAYLLADALQVSGVLAVLSAGLYLSRQSSRFFSSNTRLQANAVWNVLVFLLNGLLFLLIGLQLRNILATIAGHSLLMLIWQALLISLAVIAVRIAWVFPAASLVAYSSRSATLSSSSPLG